MVLALIIASFFILKYYRKQNVENLDFEKNNISKLGLENNTDISTTPTPIPTNT